MIKKVGRALLGLVGLIAATGFFLGAHYVGVEEPAAAAEERVVLIDNQGGRLVLHTVGGKVGGNLEDINIIFQNWVRKHPQFVPTDYQLVVQYDRRDSLRVGQ